MKLGRKPVVYNRRSQHSAIKLAAHLMKLGSAPAISYDYITAVNNTTGGDWGMLGNDQYGDCVWADTGHALMLRTANASQIIIPTTEQVLAAYSAHTGFDPANPNSDQGDDETSATEYLQQVGFLGHKADAIASVDQTNLDHVKWCVQLFGHSRIGLNLPQAAMDQMDAGTPWDVGGDTTIIGGHDVPIFGYDYAFFYVCTWGKIQKMTTAFFQAYCEEAHAEIYSDWIRSQGTAPSGFDLDTLVSDLSTVTS